MPAGLNRLVALKMTKAHSREIAQVGEHAKTPYSVQLIFEQQLLPFSGTLGKMNILSNRVKSACEGSRNRDIILTVLR